MDIFGIEGLPEVAAGDDVGALVAAAASIEPGDVVVIAQKIVSKAEGRLVAAATREEAREVARREARRVVRETPEHLIVETAHGFVCANAGVDMSNVPAGFVSLLPRDPDSSAARIRATLEARFGAPIAVIVSDTFGRAWRLGQTNVAVGASGIAPLRSYRGAQDPDGHELAVTEIAHLDELAGAAELVMGKLDRVPAAVIRGYSFDPARVGGAERGAADLVRPVDQDLFR